MPILVFVSIELLPLTFLSFSNPSMFVVKTLDSLQILPLLTCSPTLSWDVEAAKPSATIYEKSCERCEEKVGEGIIMVGDELKA